MGAGQVCQGLGRLYVGTFHQLYVKFQGTL